MKQVIAELNAAATYDEQYTYLYNVTEDLTFDNLLDLLILIERDIHHTANTADSDTPDEDDNATEKKESLLAIVKSQIQFLYNEK